MEHVSNEQKAKELGEKYIEKFFSPNVYSIERCLLDMAEWKDEQHAKEKQQWIDKACKEFCNCCAYAYMACRRYNYDNLHCRHYIKFKKAMKGE